MQIAYIKRFQGGCFRINVVSMKIEPRSGSVRIVDDTGTKWIVHMCNVIAYDANKIDTNTGDKNEL